MFTTMERLFSVSDQDITINFEFYLILCLIFSFIFTDICCWTVSHNLSQKWRDNIVLLGMLYETRQILKHIYFIAFEKFNIRQNSSRQPRYYLLRRKNLKCTIQFQVFDTSSDKITDCHRSFHKLYGHVFC